MFRGVLQGWSQGLTPITTLYLRQRGVREFLIGVSQAMFPVAILFKIPIGIFSDMYSKSLFLRPGLCGPQCEICFEVFVKFDEVR